jgi:hypothetical protein
MKIFPIYENKACILKWTWSTLFLYEGSVSSCHRSTKLKLLNDDFDNFHNYSDRIEERKRMLHNQWPGEGCLYCKEIEDVGGVSDRLHRLAIIEKDQQLKYVPLNLFENSKATFVNPRQVEVYFSNACNMSCLYCGPALSSKWVAENKQFGIVDDNLAIYEKEYRGRVDLFFEWLKKNWSEIKYLNILGGEPFYQKEYYECVEIIKTLPPNPELDFCVFTNLKISLDKLKRVTDDLFALYNSRKTLNVRLAISLDCWGEEQEYVRSGMNLKNIEKNLDYLVTLDPWLTLSVNSTMNSLSIKTMDQLLDKICVYNIKRQNKIIHSFNLLKAPATMKAHHFPNGFFSDDFQKSINMMINDPGYDTKENVDYMKGCAKLVNDSPYDPKMITKLQTYLDQMDIRHKTNWKKTFPWLRFF